MNEDGKNTKICPFCGKEILFVAKKCKYCGRWLKDAASESQHKKASSNSELNSENKKDKQEKEPEIFEKTTQDKTQKCPYCLQEIPADAKKCKYCGEWVKNKPSSKEPSDKNNKNSDDGCGCGCLILLIVIIVLVFSNYSDNIDSSSGNNQTVNIKEEVKTSSDISFEVVNEYYFENYLFIKLQIKNYGKDPFDISKLNMSVEDENGANYGGEYQSNIFAKNEEYINPEDSITKEIRFSVHKRQKYTLGVQDGSWFGDTVYIRL